MKTQTLNGKWSYRVGRGEWGERCVPYSEIPVGHSECKLVFSQQYAAKRVFLKFDGITYSAKVFLNGVHLGNMLPYSEYVFDVTGVIKARNNELNVELEDISPAFGPTAGWQNYGGIIRDVSLCYAEESYFKDVFFYCELKNGYKDAAYTVETLIGGEQLGEINVQLCREGEVVDSFTVPVNSEKTVRNLENVKLWSSEEPNLYRLRLTLCKDGKDLDAYECNVGFREIKCDRHRFVINGKQTFLQGVCRHEMVDGFGHTVPEELIRRDMLRIKEMGCNFVRLVHYPHSKKTLEIADEIGLMVSEEPGLWWSRTENPEVSNGSLEVLKRTVMRDRNHPSIAFWLCFNECRFTEQFLIDSARVCRECDPTRLVSGANCMNDDDTVKYFNLCGFDFYTMHPYSDTTEKAKKSAKVLCDKPLLFTEWGGYHVYDNPNLIKGFIEDFYSLYKQNSDEGAIAGAFFWYFRECYDYGRDGKACVDGVLKEALVDFEGKPSAIYQAFCDAFREVKSEKKYTDKYYFEQLGKVVGKPLGYANGGGDYKSALNLAKLTEWEKNKFNGMRYRRITIGPVLQKEEIDGMARTPYVVSDGTELVFNGTSTQKLTLLGSTGLNSGYPISAPYGETAATIKIEYADAETDEYPLRNGIEITTVYRTLGSSRIFPVGEKTETVAIFGYEKNFENYVLNKTEIELGSRKDIQKVTIVSAEKGYDLLIYGIFAE